MTTPALPSEQVEPLLKALSQWHYCTVIVLHGGCVFEFKGPFPPGSFSHGYYNLNSHGKGFEGHLNLATIKQVSFQDKPHRGKESYAFVFEDEQGAAIFKVFVGRDTDGKLLDNQVEQFKAIQQHLRVNNSDGTES